MLLLASNQLYNKPWSSTYYADAMHATQGWQSHLYIALELKSLSFKPICYIFGSPSARSCESRESALMCVLIYLNNVLGYYTIGDIHYVDYLMQHNNQSCIVGVVHLVYINETIICNYVYMDFGLYIMTFDLY